MNQPNTSSVQPPASTHAVSSPRRRSFKTGLYATAAAAVVGGVVYFSLRGNPAQAALPSAAAAAAPKVTVAPVEQRTLIDYQELLGRVDAVESVEIRPRVSGHIAEVRFHAGEIVNPGDVLFVIDQRTYQAQVDLAAAQLERARVRVAIAERDARRSDELLAARAISTEEADSRTSHLAEAKAELLGAQAALASARLDLEYAVVRAPIRGRVSRAFVTEGNLVSGSPGSATLLASVVSVGEVYVYADVDEATLLAFNRLSHEGRIAQADGHVTVDMQLTDESGFPHRGYIESEDNRLDPNTGSLVLRLVFPNPDGQLLPGLFARVRLPVSAPNPELLVSERAIGTDQSQKYVLTVAPDHTVTYRTVKLGPEVEGKRIIRSGLAAGDRVIVNGLQRVRPGMTVQPELAAATPASAATNGPAVAIK